MNKQFLLCIRDTGASRLQKGKVYTFLADVTCTCGKMPKVIQVEEVRTPIRKCHCPFCREKRSFTHAVYVANRFIPINDPDHREVLEKEKELTE